MLVLIKNYWWLIIIAFILLRKKADKYVNLDKTVAFEDKNYDVLTLKKAINKNLNDFPQYKLEETSIYDFEAGMVLYMLLEDKKALDENYIRIDNAQNLNYVSEVQLDWVLNVLK
ncbi:MAG: hypothetical protein RLZZ236_1944 [Bacteroidota bacterium]|jgi:hypothetical protein